MAMLSQSVPLSMLGCPEGVCRGQIPPTPKSSWRALTVSFAAGALAVSAVVAFAGSAPAPFAPRADAARDAAAAEWAAYVRAQTPREQPPEWRWQIKRVDFDGMFRKQR
jgi:hypothetical protein